MYRKIDKMIKDLEIRGRTPNTIKNMVWSIKNFSKFYNQPLELLGEQDIINYLDYCINQKELYSIFFTLVLETLIELAKDKKYICYWQVGSVYFNLNFNSAWDSG